MPSLSRARAKATQAVVELLRYLNKQWCFQWIFTEDSTFCLISYHFMGHDGQSTKSRSPQIYPHKLHIIVNLRFFRRADCFIATSAEIIDGSEPGTRFFKFLWDETGAICEIIEIKIDTSGGEWDAYYDFQRNRFMYPHDHWPQCIEDSDNS